MHTYGQARSGQYDVIVIGAGLGGSAAALALARGGARVLLLERQHYPHDKLCGEFLSPETEASFRAMGVWDAMVDAGAVRLTEALLTAPDGATFQAPLPGAAIGFSRLRLDPLLAEAAARAGADFRDGCPATEVSGSLVAGFEVRTQAGDRFQARAVVGAWGKRSTMDRSLGRRFFAQRQPFLGLKAHFQGFHTGQRIEMHGFHGGYLGLSAIEGGAHNACLLATDAVFLAAGRDPEALFRAIAHENEAIAAQLHGAERITPILAISQVAFARKAPVEQGIIMLGDSAQLIAPLAGNGMAIALRCAELATPRLLRFLADGDAHQLTQGYVNAWRHEFRARLLLGQLLQPLFLRPALLSLGLRLAQRMPTLGQALIKGTRDSRVAV